MPLITAADAVARFQLGEVVAIPTETVYGLGACIDNPTALQRIFTLKQRPFFDPLIVHVSHISSARELAGEWPDLFTLLADHFWPGPLTLIVKKTAEVSSVITSGLDTVALRCPNHPVALAILGAINVPIAAPSANRFGRTSPTTAAHVLSEFADAVSVVDGGPCEIGLESTVVSAQVDNGKWKISILRPGGVSRQNLFDVLKREKINFTLQRESSVASPGHLNAHYRPNSPLVLLTNEIWSDSIRKSVEEKLGRSLRGWQELQLHASAQQTARELYENLRRLSQGPDYAIWLNRTADHASDDWEAIWDRLERASSLHL